MNVAFQGEPGAYSEAAALAYFGPKVATLPCHAFNDVFEAVQGEKAECGLIPIENSLAGSIHQNYDLLLQNQLYIVGEYFLRVQHCLIALPGVQMRDIRTVISHPQGLAQCDRYLRSLGVQPEIGYDTAGSVRILKERGDRTLAAIASRRAAEVYEMNILQEGVEDNPANYTRFLVIDRKPVFPGDDAKTSIVFSTKNIPGALFKALSVFALRDIDLLKIESRPLVGKPWEYMFYIDCEGSTTERRVTRALEHLGEYATTLRVLGSYVRHIRTSDT
ncbi:MAG: prephenate dehydratase [Chloroflexota bacterium]